MANLTLVTPTNPGIAEWSDGNALFGFPFPWYGSGTDGALTITDSFYISSYYTQNTTFTMSNSTFVGLCSTPEQSYVEIMATESITITNSGLFSSGNSGNSGQFGGGGGSGGPGASPGTDGIAGTTGEGEGQGFNAVINMTNRSNLGARSIGGSGGASGVLGGGDGGFIDIDVCGYFPPFRALFIGGTAPRWAISAGGFGGGAGAGDGVGDTGGSGGGGGGGGGAIVFRAPVISITNGSGLLAEGGSGGDGQNATGGNAAGGGGGAGGNGGLIVFVTESLTLGDTEIVLTGGTGGAGGTGAGTGGAGGLGGLGAAGEAWWYRPSTNTWTQVA